MSKALLVLDLINDIIDEKGSVGKDGFYNQAIKRDVVENTSNAIAWFRKKDYQLFMWWSDSVRDILNGMVI